MQIINQLVALDTILGRALSGSFQPLPSVYVLSTHMLKISSVSSVIRYDKLEKFWDAESFQNLWKKRFSGKRYIVPLPWKPNHELLPDNYINCVKRLQALPAGRRNSPELLQEYDG